MHAASHSVSINQHSIIKKMFRGITTSQKLWFLNSCGHLQRSRLPWIGSKSISAITAELRRWIDQAIRGLPWHKAAPLWPIWTRSQNPPRNCRSSSHAQYIHHPSAPENNWTKPAGRPSEMIIQDWPEFWFYGSHNNTNFRGQFLPKKCVKWFCKYFLIKNGL